MNDMAPTFPTLIISTFCSFGPRRLFSGRIGRISGGDVHVYTGRFFRVCCGSFRRLVAPPTHLRLVARGRRDLSQVNPRPNSNHLQTFFQRSSLAIKSNAWCYEPLAFALQNYKSFSYYNRSHAIPGNKLHVYSCVWADRREAKNARTRTWYENSQL